MAESSSLTDADFVESNKENSNDFQEEKDLIRVSQSKNVKCEATLITTN